MAKTAESLGFESLWCAEHPIMPVHSKSRFQGSAEGGEAAVFDADVTRSDDCAAMVDDVVRRWGRLDILDNNVGIGGRGTVVEVSEEDWERVMRVNVTGMMLASKHAIPVLARGGGGAIVHNPPIPPPRPPGPP